jgi:chromosome segregation ATPase
MAEKITITEYAEITGKSERRIRELCSKGLLPCIKEKIPTGERYLIYYERGNNEIIEKTLFTEEGGRKEGSEEGSEEIMSEYNNSHMINVVYQLMDQNQKQQENLQDVYSKLAVYAEQIGQIRFITDNNKYYQDEYFRLKHEIDALQKVHNELGNKFQEIENENLNLKNELLEKKTSLKNIQDENHKLRKEYNRLLTELENKSRWAFWK